jgi:hypothetical protein
VVVLLHLAAVAVAVLPGRALVVAPVLVPIRTPAS